MPPRPRRTSDSRGTRLGQLLHHLGWSLGAFSEPRPILPRGAATVQTAPLPGGDVLTLVDVGDRMPPTDALFRAFEDLTDDHRAIQTALVQANISARLALLHGAGLATQLVDFDAEEVLLATRNEAETTSRLLPLLDLNAIARGALGAFPRKSLRHRAQELADWSRLWTTQVGGAGRISREIAQLLMQWLLLARLAEEAGLPIPARHPFRLLALRRADPARHLAPIFAQLATRWDALHGAAPDVIAHAATMAHQGGQLAPCLASFSRLSRSKFTAEVFADAFSDEDLRAVGWRQALLGPLPPELPTGNEWIEAGYTAPLDTLGFPPVLAVYDAIVADLSTLCRDREMALRRGERPGVQIDLLAGEPPEFTEADCPRIALERVLLLETARRTRADAARLVLSARALEAAARFHRRGAPDPLLAAPRIHCSEPPPRPAPRPAPPRPSADDAQLN
jgi:hypothetical protein